MKDLLKVDQISRNVFVCFINLLSTECGGHLGAWLILFPMQTQVDFCHNSKPIFSLNAETQKVERPTHNSNDSMRKTLSKSRHKTCIEPFWKPTQSILLR